MPYSERGAPRRSGRADDVAAEDDVIPAGPEPGGLVDEAGPLAEPVDLLQQHDVGVERLDLAARSARGRGRRRRRAAVDVEGQRATSRSGSGRRRSARAGSAASARPGGRDRSGRWAGLGEPLSVPEGPVADGPGGCGMPLGRPGEPSGTRSGRGQSTTSATIVARATSARSPWTPAMHSCRIGAVRHVTDDERRARLALRHGLAPEAAAHRRRGGHPGDDRAARDRAADASTSRCWARVDGVSVAPTSTRRSTTTAPWSSSWRCAAPCSSSRATCCRRPGGAPSARVAAAERAPARQGRRARRARRRRRGLGRSGARRRRARPARRRPAGLTAAEIRARGARRSTARSVARAQVGRRRADRAAGARPARRRGRDRARRQRRPLADLPAAVDPDGGAGWARCPSRSPSRRGTPSWCGAGCAPSARAPRTDLVVVAGRDQGAPSARRWPTSAPSRSPSTAAAPAGCCPTTSSRPTPVEPWAALLPVLDPTMMGWKERASTSAPHAPYLFDTQRQRRHHRLVGRPDRRLLGPGRRRRGRRWCCVEDVGTGAPARARRRGRPADRLARRRAGSAPSTPRRR